MQDEVDTFTYGIENIRVHFGDLGKVSIGKFCSIAHNCNIYLAANHNYHNVTSYPFGYRHVTTFPYPRKNTLIVRAKGVSIGNDVWIGANCTIMDGVQIGDGAVIANHSHVVKSVGAYEVVGGNPAKHIKHRFTFEQIERLLATKWWDSGIDTINRHLPLLCNTDVDAFLDAFEKEPPPSPIVSKYTYL